MVLVDLNLERLPPDALRGAARDIARHWWINNGSRGVEVSSRYRLPGPHGTVFEPDFVVRDPMRAELLAIGCVLLGHEGAAARIKPYADFVRVAPALLKAHPVLALFVPRGDSLPSVDSLGDDQLVVFQY